MKKIFVVLFCFTLLISGCSQKGSVSVEKDSANNNTSENVGSQSNSSTEKTGKISMEKAKEIALSDAGVNESAITDLSTEADDYEGKYDISFKYGGKEYDYDIDFINGNIISKDVEIDD